MERERGSVNMRGSLKPKRISWASDLNLCQVRLFLSEESPSHVGLSTQDHLQAKASWVLHSNATGSDDNLPPGFEGAHSELQSNFNLSQIPLIKWKRPPSFKLDFTWQVVAGEESKEVEVQNQRGMRVLEAIYPRPSSIPPNPAVSLEADGIQYDEQQILLIPITPIEDEDVVADTSYDLITPTDIPISSQSSLITPGIPYTSYAAGPSIIKTPITNRLATGVVPGVAPDIAAAATAAFTAIMKSNEQGNLIDQELLIKILNNPTLIEKFVTDYGAGNPHGMHNQMWRPGNLTDIPPAHISRPETCNTSVALTSSGPMFPQTIGSLPFAPPRPPLPVFAAGPASSLPSVGASKDLAYYKNLIQQHGEERQQEAIPQFGAHRNLQPGSNQESLHNPKPRDPKTRIMKPCIYYNSSRGCRHGANCAYQHDASFQQRVNSLPEVQSAKRMKMDREITGT